MSNNIYDIMNKLNAVANKDMPATKTEGTGKTLLESTMKEVLNEKYMGFDKTVAAIKKGGSAKNPEAVAASIGRKKYGKEKFQKAAAAGKKLGESEHLPEDDMEEGNKFTGNLAKARAAGKKHADLDGDGDMETVREGAKPDYIDLDKDGNREETMKKAAADKKKQGVKGSYPYGQHKPKKGECPECGTVGGHEDDCSRHSDNKKQGVSEGSDKLQGTPVVSLSDFGKKDTVKNKYGHTVPKKLKKDDPRVKFYKDEKKDVSEGTLEEIDRRGFLKGLGVAGGSVATAGGAAVFTKKNDNRISNPEVQFLLGYIDHSMKNDNSSKNIRGDEELVKMLILINEKFKRITGEHHELYTSNKDQTESSKEEIEAYRRGARQFSKDLYQFNLKHNPAWAQYAEVYPKNNKQRMFILSKVREAAMKLLSLASKYSINEGTKETSTGRVHKAEPGGYGRKDDEDEDKKKDKKAEPAVKRGRGRPKKDADSDTGEVKNWDTDTLQRWIVGSVPKKLPGKASVKHKIKDEPDEKLDEVAPPGAKAERMVKHIKQGYAKDGKVTPKEKGIAYATAWKAKKAGKVEESIPPGFPRELAKRIYEHYDGDMNSTLTAMWNIHNTVMESKVSGSKKKLSEGITFEQSTTKPAKNAVPPAVQPAKKSVPSAVQPDKKSVPSAEPRSLNPADDYTEDDMLPSPGFLRQLDRIQRDNVRIANPLVKNPKPTNPGMPFEQSTIASTQKPVMGTYKGGVWTADPPKKGEVGVPVPQNIDGGSAPAPTKSKQMKTQKKAEVDTDTDLAEMLNLAGIKSQVDEAELAECGMSSSPISGGYGDSMHNTEGRMNISTNMSTDGNKSVTITADGDAAAELMQMLKIAGLNSDGMSNVKDGADLDHPGAVEIHGTMDSEGAEELAKKLSAAELDEAKDPRYHANTTPEEEVLPVQTQLKGGDGDVAGKEKKMRPHGYKFSDNPLTMKESMSLKLIKEYEGIKKTV